MRGLGLLRVLGRAVSSIRSRADPRLPAEADVFRASPPSQGFPQPANTPAPLNLSVSGVPVGVRGAVYRSPAGEPRLLSAIFNLSGGDRFVYVFTDARRLGALDAVRVDVLDGYVRLDVADLAMDPTLRFHLAGELRADR